MSDFTITHTSSFPSAIDADNSVTFTDLAEAMDIPTSNVRFGKFRRNVDPEAQVTKTSDKMIPDSATNSHVSAGSNHKISTMTNLITEYRVDYSPGTDTLVNHNLSTALNQGATNWAQDKSKNIAKRVNIVTDGGAGRFHGTSNASTSGAVVINDSYLNLDIDFNDSDLRGVGGAGGATNVHNENDTNKEGHRGGNGGNALYINNTINSGNDDTKRVNISWGTNAKFYGGGGGGGGGKDGTTGGSVRCHQNVVQQSQNAGTWTRNPPLHTGQKYMRGRKRRGKRYANREHVETQQQTYEARYATARIGGAGGVGAGSGGGYGLGNPDVATTTTTGTDPCSGTAYSYASTGGGDGGTFGADGQGGFSPGGNAGKWLKKGGDTLVGHPDTSTTINKGPVG